MQISHYLKVYPYEEETGHLILFSTKQASKVLIKKETFLSIERGTLLPEDADLLTKLGMIVPDREAEKRSIVGIIENLNTDNPGMAVMVVLNLDCNFGCIYCYEGGIKGDLYMSEQTAHQFVKFIKSRFTGNKKTLVVDFYGGEPLLSIPLIKSIASELQAFTQKMGATFYFTLITNGSLFARKVARELVPLGLRSAKITIDGPADIHNRYRPFKSGAGSFDIIIKNIKETCDLVDIGIGGNFDFQTYEKFVGLLDRLEEEGLTPDKIHRIKFDPVVQCPEGRISPMDYHDGCMSINEPWMVAAERLLRNEILKRGYHTFKPVPMICMVENDGAFVVNYSGEIYKCPAFIGQKEFAMGDLQTGLKDGAGIYKPGIWKNGECVECEYLPLCFGGCRYMTYIRDNKIDKPDCRRAYLDESLETLIKQDLLYSKPS
ncbi:geopeptide radical SAM maturase [Thermodesulfobacteriota bacterium]